MWECKNAAEPIDLKLMMILFIRKLWMPILAFFAGMFVVGIICFIKEVTLAPEPTYTAATELYVDYTANEEGEYKYYALNAEGWESIIKTDVILESVKEKLSFEVSLEILRNTIKVNPRTDHRFLQIITTYKEKGQTVAIANAIEESVVSFAKNMRECENVRIFTSAKEAKLVIVDIHMLRAALLGGMLFTLLCLFLMWISFLLDDSIYVPIMFEKRYQLPMFDREKLEESKIAYCFVNLGEEAINKLEQPAVLTIEAGKRNGKLIEKAINDIRKQKANIIGAILLNADDKLIKQYYFGVRRK